MISVEFISGIAIVVLLLVIYIIVNILQKTKVTNKENIKELFEKIDTAVPDILDIFDEFLSKTDSVSKFNTLEDFKNDIINKVIDKSIDYIGDNLESLGIPEDFVEYLTSDRLRDKIEDIIVEYKYDINISTVFNRFKDLETNDSIEDVDKQADTNIVESINDFYSDTEGTDV